MKPKRVGKQEDPDDARYWLVAYRMDDGTLRHVRKLRHMKEGYGHPGLRHPNSDSGSLLPPARDM